MFQRNLRTKLEEHISCPITFPPESRAVYKHGRAGQASDDNVIRRMHYACWITKATEAHSEYVIVLVAFPRQQWLRERGSMLSLYVYCLLFFCCRCCLSEVDLESNYGENFLI